MSIRIQRCHPQVHATHIDFKMSHSLKRSLSAKSSEVSHIDELEVDRMFQHVGARRVARDTMHDGSSDLAKSHGRGIARCSPTYSCQS